jgi:hypothetical protein
MTNRDQRETLRRRLPTLAGQLAAELGDDWTTTTANADCVTLHGPDHVQLGLCMTWNSDVTVTVRGQYPVANAWRQLTSHALTVSANRLPADIAARIRRMLLPAYLPDLATALQLQAEYDAARAEQIRVADLIAATLPALRRSGELGERLYLYGPDRVSITVDHGGRVRLFGHGLTINRALLALHAVTADATDAD